MKDTVPRARLSGRAHQFLLMLRDFGHLDEEASDRLVVAACDMVSQPNGVIELHVVRRMAAMMLAPGKVDGDFTVMLAEDWPLLFS